MLNLACFAADWGMPLLNACLAATRPQPSLTAERLVKWAGTGGCRGGGGGGRADAGATAAELGAAHLGSLQGTCLVQAGPGGAGPRALQPVCAAQKWARAPTSTLTSCLCHPPAAAFRTTFVPPGTHLDVLAANHLLFRRCHLALTSSAVLRADVAALLQRLGGDFTGGRACSWTRWVGGWVGGWIEWVDAFFAPWLAGVQPVSNLRATLHLPACSGSLRALLPGAGHVVCHRVHEAPPTAQQRS